MLALCLDAVETYDTEHRLDGLTSGAYQVAWTGPGFARGWDNRPASELIQCLAHQAWAYAVAGLEISASDCWWLISHLKAETLTVTGGPI
jgi:hypothetical protein